MRTPYKAPRPQLIYMPQSTASQQLIPQYSSMQCDNRDLDALPLRPQSSSVYRGPPPNLSYTNATAEAQRPKSSMKRQE